MLSVRATVGCASLSIIGVFDTGGMDGVDPDAVPGNDDSHKAASSPTMPCLAADVAEAPGSSLPTPIKPATELIKHDRSAVALLDHRRLRPRRCGGRRSD